MGKKKKITEKVRLFYRGPRREPAKIATEDEKQIIGAALRNLSNSEAFETIWNGEKTKLRIVFGLKSTLRYLKRKQVKALIYDEIASDHLKKFLNEFAFQLHIPILQAQNLIELGTTIKLQSLLVVSVVDAEFSEDTYRSNDPKPKPLRIIPASESVQLLLQMLQNITTVSTSTYEPPILDKVLSSGKNRAKKEAKKKLKVAKKERKS